MEQIKQLIHLLDAESDDVRNAVREELAQQMPEVQAFLEEHAGDLEPGLLFQLDELQREWTGRNVRADWLDWLSLDDEYQRLEAALDYLGRLDERYADMPPLAESLDQLASSYTQARQPKGVLTLNRFLFGGGQFRGVQEAYYHPGNANLFHVLETGHGLPISLVALFMLCGARHDFQVFGFNLPGHFLARADIFERVHLFDCFNGGKILNHREVAHLSTSPNLDYQALIESPPTAVDMVLRFLANLINAHYRAGEMERYQLYGRLHEDLKNLDIQPARRGFGSDPLPQFQVGQLVRHKRYSYRGVVVDYDMSCEADESWYRRNQTQPARDQPWYHVLVSGSEVHTYAAESSLAADYSGREVRHPLLNTYFSDFQRGRYVRNETPWPEK